MTAGLTLCPHAAMRCGAASAMRHSGRVQEEVVRDALAGRNILVVMPTGSGKSLLYQLPVLMSDGLTPIVPPSPCVSLTFHPPPLTLAS